MRADPETEAADRDTLFVFLFLKVAIARRRIEPRFAGLFRAERSAGERVLRADVNAGSAFSAPRLHRESGRFQWRIGKNSNPPDPGAMIRSYEQTTLADPAQTGEMCCEFLREDSTDILVGSPLGCRYGKGTIPGPLELVRHPERNLVKGQVHYIVTTMTVQDCGGRVFFRQEIDKAVLQHHADGDGYGIPGNTFPSLRQNKSVRRREISDAEIVSIEG